jgi:hypothetical protein
MLLSHDEMLFKNAGHWSIYNVLYIRNSNDRSCISVEDKLNWKGWILLNNFRLSSVPTFPNFPYFFWNGSYFILFLKKRFLLFLLFCSQGRYYVTYQLLVYKCFMLRYSCRHSRHSSRSISWQMYVLMAPLTLVHSSAIQPDLKSSQLYSQRMKLCIPNY